MTAPVLSDSLSCECGCGESVYVEGQCMWRVSGCNRYKCNMIGIPTGCQEVVV